MIDLHIRDQNSCVDQIDEQVCKKKQENLKQCPSSNTFYPRAKWKCTLASCNADLWKPTPTAPAPTKRTASTAKIAVNTGKEDI